MVAGTVFQLANREWLEHGANANNRVSYHNLYYLSADNGGAGRLYNFSRGTHQSANSLLFNTPAIPGPGADN